MNWTARYTWIADVGRIFYGVAMAVMGFQTVQRGDFPYMLIPYKHSGIPGLTMIAYVFGCLLVTASLCIVFRKQARPASLLLGAVLLVIFCCYFVPYQLMVSDNYMKLVDWENAEKELALAAGAFIIAGTFSGNGDIGAISFIARLIPLGAILFCITIISFGIIHFQYAKDVADYVPAWMPFRLFWACFAGAALISSGLAIVFNIKAGLAAILLGIMIFIWFAVLHMPRVIVSPPAYLRSEITSAVLALAYSGIAFVIAGHKLQTRYL